MSHRKTLTYIYKHINVGDCSSQLLHLLHLPLHTPSFPPPPAHHEVGIADVVFDQSSSNNNHPTVDCACGYPVQDPDVCKCTTSTSKELEPVK